MMYSGAVPPSIDSSSQLQYLYQGCQHPSLQNNSVPVPHVRNSMSQFAPTGAMENYRRLSLSHSRAIQQNSSQSHSLSSPISSQLPRSRGGDGSASKDTASGSKGQGSGHTARTEGSDSRMHNSNHSDLPPIPQAPYLPGSTVPWPGWRGASVLSPFDFPPPDMTSPNVSQQQVVFEALPIVPHNPVDVTREEDQGIRYEESKRTAQRRAQRARKASFIEKSQQWPMTIQCTAEGGIPKDVRPFVHRQFRASARRFLKMSTIHFRDHPDSDIKVVVEDIDRRFVFNPPLRAGYIMWFIENSLRTSRYLWRKHWVKTGRGEKHKWCPQKYFPALVKYWKSAEAEEESKRMKEARNAAKEKKRLLLERKDHSNIAIDDAWDPLVDEDDENLIWDDSDYSENSIPCVDLTDSIGRDDPEFNVRPFFYPLIVKYILPSS
ncbi:hypothetical protein KC19_7G020300 [Ceratodon purpureus]|uniref:Uncharacterized protein n=1 Tax=Ceratodon purpureus TaxID=3225 RepID=A0A8T0H6G7_CERPU|nr:hypothetical protein KC19_7G020300 [Ceratodon purpureus]